MAFNAPIGGSIFVFESLTTSFTLWLLVATLAAATSAVVIMCLILGNQLDFAVGQVSLTTFWQAWPLLPLGALLGVVGALYNSTIIGFLRVADRFSRFTSLQRAAFIGATVGLAAWLAPPIVGGGNNLTQAVLSGHYTIAALAVFFTLRFFIGPWPDAAGTPGACSRPC